jgi:hypothetical protein
LPTDLTESLMDISRTLGSISADVVNIKEDIASHREDAATRNEMTVSRLDNAAMRLAKLEAQIEDIAPEVGTLKRLRERGMGIVGAVGLIGTGIGAGGALIATHWGAVAKVLSSLTAMLPKV